MKFTSFSTLFFASAALAAPAAVAGDYNTQIIRNEYDTAVLNPAKFFLVANSTDARINGKCAVTYHTGAGTSDAVFQSCGSAPAKNFNFASNKINFTGYSGVNSSVTAEPGTGRYNSWGPVTIDAGAPGSLFTYNRTTGGFKQKANGLGFLACRWAHDGEFQLFALGKANPVSLANCAKINLYRGCYNTDPYCNKGGSIY